MVYKNVFITEKKKKRKKKKVIILMSWVFTKDNFMSFYVVP